MALSFTCSASVLLRTLVLGLGLLGVLAVNSDDDYSTTATANTIAFLLSLNETLSKYANASLVTLPSIQEYDEWPGPSPVNHVGTIDTEPKLRFRRDEQHESNDKRYIQTRTTIPLDIIGSRGHPFGLSTPGELDPGVPGIPTLFDTGSWNYVVPGIRCCVAEGCYGDLKYREEGTFTEDLINLGLLSGSIGQARSYVDDVKVGEVMAREVRIDSLQSVQYQPTTAHGTAAIMGLSFAGASFRSLMKALVDDGLNDEFSFYFSRKQDDPLDVSELMIGGSKPGHFRGALTTVPVLVPGEWMLRVENVAYAPQVWYGILASGAASIDTGFDSIILPEMVARMVMEQVPNRWEIPRAIYGHLGAPFVTWLAPCSNVIFTSLRFGNVAFDVNSADLIGDRMDMNLFVALGYYVPPELRGGLPVCEVKIMGGAIVSPRRHVDAVIGTPFLKSWYSIYSADGEGSISFAKSKPLSR